MTTQGFHFQTQGMMYNMKKYWLHENWLFWNSQDITLPYENYESKIFDGPQLFFLRLKLPKILLKKPLH